MFLGRENELAELNRLYDSDIFEFVVMYGRRRVGKTTLISEFVKGKQGIFFVSQEYDHETALSLFSEKVQEFFNLSGLTPFKNWNHAFEYIAKQAAEKRLILVLDEFPYLANANKSIPSILQNLIDHNLKDSKLFLIICGSSMSFMEKGVLSAKSPLYGRLTSQMKIEPFGFYESCAFFPKYSVEDKVIVYGITGGVPFYLQRFKDSRTIKENVLNAILKKTSYLYEEPRNLLKQELREPMIYNSIIEAIAKGSSKLNEITSKTGLQSDKCAKYIHSLIELQILTKETPVGEKGGRKSIYRITDNYFKFWYRFIFDNIELVEQNESELLYDTKIEPFLSDYIGRNVFEDICKQYLRKQNAKRCLPFIFTKIGRWWGTNNKEKKQVEIDLIAFHDKEAIFAECKWRNEPLDTKDIESLFDKSALFTDFEEKTFYFFAKSGFSKSAKKMARDSGMVKLVDLQELFFHKNKELQINRFCTNINAAHSSLPSDI